MKNASSLHIDEVDIQDLGEDFGQAQHTCWILNAIKLNDSARKIYEKELMDIIIRSKTRVGKLCKI